MSQILEMPTLYARLSKIGFTPKFIREKALPEWWDSELEQDPVAVMEAAGRIAKRLGLDITSVFNPDAPITFKKGSSPKFKKRQDTDEERLFVAQGLATRVAEMVTFASKSTFKGTLPDVFEIRRQILQHSPAIDIDGLLQFCWSCGLPVVHFSSFPPKSPKMDGMAAQLNSCPAIVISSKHPFSARLLFIIVHELGHIACGHVNNGVLVDEDIGKEIQDSEEQEANDFAVKLLFGKQPNYQWSQKLNPNALLSISCMYGRRDRVDPGTVALNYAWHTKDWSNAVCTLKLIEPQANASAKINSYLATNLNWERLDTDCEEYLKLITGV